MFKKILVCLDSSHLAEQILPYATDTALRFGSKLVMIQVIAPSTVLPEVDTEKETPAHTDRRVSEKIQREENEARAYLERVAQPLRKSGLDVECVTFEDTIDEGIVNYAEKNEVDLIAIATHGRSGLGRSVFGSVSDSVLRKSGLPILVIKPREVKA